MAWAFWRRQGSDQTRCACTWSSTLPAASPLCEQAWWRRHARAGTLYLGDRNDGRDYSLLAELSARAPTGWCACKPTRAGCSKRRGRCKNILQPCASALPRSRRPARPNHRRRDRGPQRQGPGPRRTDLYFSVTKLTGRYPSRPLWCPNLNLQEPNRGQTDENYFPFSARPRFASCKTCLH
jgi:hypothetical protein